MTTRGRVNRTDLNTEYDDTPADVKLLDRICPAIPATDAYLRSEPGSEQAAKLLSGLRSILWPGRERRAVDFGEQQ